MKLFEEAIHISRQSITKVLPDDSVRQALEGKNFGEGRLILIAAGKAAWRMAKAAVDSLGKRIDGGIVITKYGHIMGDLPGLVCCEGGHPLPDKNSIVSTHMAIQAVNNLSSKDMVLFLLSGGGSSLFEVPLLPETELRDLTTQLLASGASITEINTIRKRLSAVKAGRFAQLCQPAKVFSIILSDVLGGHVDMIASGPCFPDKTTKDEVTELVHRYNLKLSSKAISLLYKDTPKELSNVEYKVIGSVTELCIAASQICATLGYEPLILTDSLCCEAREAGRMIASMASYLKGKRQNIAIILGGETVVHVNGSGIGGRNQELALSASIGIAGISNAAIFSVSSDGTDGPTDAAGGFVDGRTKSIIESSSGKSIQAFIDSNDSYNALSFSRGLIKTGPTGTNVNDLTVALLR